MTLLKDWNGKKAGERLAMSADDATPLVAAGIAKAVTDDPLAPIIVRGLENTLAGWTKGLDALINQTLHKIADAQSQATKHAVPVLFGPGGYRSFSGRSSPYTSPANDAGALTYDRFGNILSQTGAAYRGVYGFTGRPTDGPAPAAATFAS